MNHASLIYFGLVLNIILSHRYFQHIIRLDKLKVARHISLSSQKLRSLIHLSRFKVWLKDADIWHSNFSLLFSLSNATFKKKPNTQNFIHANWLTIAVFLHIIIFANLIGKCMYPKFNHKKVQFCAVQMTLGIAKNMFFLSLHKPKPSQFIHEV